MVSARQKVFKLFEDKDELQALMKAEPGCLGLSEGRTQVLMESLAMTSVITTRDETAIAIQKVVRGHLSRKGHAARARVSVRQNSFQ